MSRKNNGYRRNRRKKYKIMGWIVVLISVAAAIWFTRPHREMEPPARVTVAVTTSPIHALFLPPDATEIPNRVAEAGCNAVVLDMKSERGMLGYVSDLPLAIEEKHSLADPGRNSALRRLTLTPNLYTVARVFFDENTDYLNDICVELAKLGFDELLIEGIPDTGLAFASLDAALAPYPVALSFLVPTTRPNSRLKRDTSFLRYADHLWTNSDLSTRDGLPFPKEDTVFIGASKNTAHNNWAILDETPN